MKRSICKSKGELRRTEVKIKEGWCLQLVALSDEGAGCSFNLDSLSYAISYFMGGLLPATIIHCLLHHYPIGFHHHYILWFITSLCQQTLVCLTMINIISQQSQLNPQLTEFPSANANIAIFGTQSSGKSTLMNTVFGTSFPVLNTLITRGRCTKGVWFQNRATLNVIDTQGFDAGERAAEQKILQKQVALFCLAMADVLIINMWMNEVGRYEGSHSHILKAIIRASERIISAQQKKIIVVVRDCSQDADRTLLRQQLATNIMDIIRAESKTSTLKFSFDYFLMSHFEDNRNQFIAEGKELLQLVSTIRKSSLSHYSPQDRVVYIRELWEKITSAESEIDLRSIEDALKNHALGRLNNETVSHISAYIDGIVDLSKMKTFERYNENILNQVRNYFLRNKPKHIGGKELQRIMHKLNEQIQNKISKQFITVILPAEEDRMLQKDYQTMLDQQQSANHIGHFNTIRQQTHTLLVYAHQQLVKGFKDHHQLTTRFTQLIQATNIKYELFIEHLYNLFEIELQRQLNEQLNRQTDVLTFQNKGVNEIIKKVEAKHKLETEVDIRAIWENVSVRVMKTSLINRFKQLGQAYAAPQLGAVMGNQTDRIVTFYGELQQKAYKFIFDLINYLTPHHQQPLQPLQLLQQIHQASRSLIQKKIMEQNRTFKISLLMVGLFMFCFYSQFSRILQLMGMGKKKVRRWSWVYVCAMLSIFGVILLRNKQTWQQVISRYSSS